MCVFINQMVAIAQYDAAKARALTRSVDELFMQFN